jgi:hypothetical protein
MDGMRLENMDRIWLSLSGAPEVPVLKKNPAFHKYTDRNLWITSKSKAFRAHLKATAYQKPVLWDCRVYSDKDLVETWLKTAKAQGHKIYDSEVANYEGGFIAMDIAELVEPPKLVILVLGVKEAPNKETPTVLLEAVRTRMHLGKATWIVDQPSRRIDSDFHRGYSDTLYDMLQGWSHFEISGVHVSLTSGPNPEIRRDHVVATDVDDLLDDLLDEDEEEEEVEEVEEEEGEEEEEEVEDGGEEEEEEVDADEVDETHELEEEEGNTEPEVDEGFRTFDVKIEPDGPKRKKKKPWSRNKKGSK